MNQEISEQKTTVETGASSSGKGMVPQIPDHTMLRRIGEGSYGEVWLARNVMGTYRAVKIVYRSTFSSDRPYEREFNGIEKFEPISRSQDGLVDVLHVGRNDEAGYFYYVMELADDASSKAERVAMREPLSNQLRPESAPPQIINPQSAMLDPCDYVSKTLSTELKAHGRLPLTACLELAISLTEALAHLHKNGLVHRDIKPSNVIFVGGVPKLADIGLVASVTDARTFVGTEGYISPEGPGTAQADIYSLGKVLYEICTGKDRHKFPELPTDLANAEDRAALLEINEVILRACESDPRQRYRTAEQLRADLLLLQSGKSPKPSKATKLGEWSTALLDRLGRHPRAKMGALAGALVVVFVLLVLSLDNKQNQRGTSDQAARPVQMLPASIAALPAGEVLKLAYSGRPPSAGAQDIRPKLQFEILAKRQDETNFHALNDGQALRSEVDVYLIVTRTLSAGYLYIFQVDTFGQKDWLFPANGFSKYSSGENPVAAEQIVQVPSEKTGKLYLDRNTGTEHIYAVFSATRWPELEEALAKPSPPLARPESTLIARRIQEPIGLRMRGVGGVRTNTAPIDIAQLIERIHPGQTYKVKLSAPTVEAAGSFLALERWFKHVE